MPIDWFYFQPALPAVRVPQDYRAPRTGTRRKPKRKK